jgi:Hemerythrin HHE cation binding domain.
MVNDSDLMEDHREVDSKLDKLTKIISNGEIDPELFMQISNSLKRHIYIEEETIFPSVSEGDNDMSKRIVGLEMEHASIWMLLDRVEKEISVQGY